MITIVFNLLMISLVLLGLVGLFEVLKRYTNYAKIKAYTPIWSPIVAILLMWLVFRIQNPIIVGLFTGGLAVWFFELLQSISSYFAKPK